MGWESERTTHTNRAWFYYRRSARSASIRTKPGACWFSLLINPECSVRSILPILIAFCIVTAAPASAQRGDVPGSFGSEAGLQVLLTNSGFGLGGYYSHEVSPDISLMLDVSIAAGKDEREARFFRFGSSFVPGKANYLLLMPVQGGASIRLFRNEIEDNFRPYLQLTAGPVFGWIFPYFDDCNGNGNLDEQADCDGDGIICDGEGERTFGVFQAFPRGSMKFGAGGMIALGAKFGENRRTTQGIRIGYAFNYFHDGIRLMERHIEPEPRRYIGSPTITLTLGRLFSGESMR